MSTVEVRIFPESLSRSCSGVLTPEDREPRGRGVVPEVYRPTDRQGHTHTVCHTHVPTRAPPSHRYTVTDRIESRPPRRGTCYCEIPNRTKQKG